MIQNYVLKSQGVLVLSLIPQDDKTFKLLKLFQKKKNGSALLAGAIIDSY